MAEFLTGFVIVVLLGGLIWAICELLELLDFGDFDSDDDDFE